MSDRNVRTRDVMRYLRRLHRLHRRSLVVVMDRLNVHRAAVRKLHERGAAWLDVEWLPAYAPDLNPVEALWSHAKHSALTNFVPDDVDHLYDAVVNIACITRSCSARSEPMVQSTIYDKRPTVTRPRLSICCEKQSISFLRIDAEGFSRPVTRIAQWIRYGANRRTWS